MAQQPNILFIMADQMAAPMLSMYGGVAKTPHLQKLADQGVVFDSAYCNSPLCAPSRYVLMTGMLPHRIGAYDNAADFPADIPTFAHYLRKGGYKTALSGKMHFCGPDQLHGFEERLTTDIYPADYGWFPNWEKFDDRPTWYHNMSSVTQAGPTLRTNQLDFDDEVVFNAERYLYDYLRESDERPFMLTVSMTHPHDPYAITSEYWDRYSDDEIPMPSHECPFNELDPHSQRLHHVYQMDRSAISDQQIRNARHAYMGAISYVDDQIGRLMKILKESGLDQNTIVVFSGDHGDMLGEHGLWYKMSYREWSARVPMIISAPGQFAAGRVTNSVSTMDLLPTFCDFAKLTPDFAMPLDGRSLISHLTPSSTPTGHDEVIGEYMGEGVISPMFMIRRGDYKYIHCPGDPDQLFNVTQDPNELTNLAADETYVVMLKAFQEETQKRWDIDQITQDVIVSQRRRRLVNEAHQQGITPHWDHQPMRDAHEQYMRNHIDLDDLEAKARFPRVR
jgi:choline-sulfatase